MVQAGPAGRWTATFGRVYAGPKADGQSAYGNGGDGGRRKVGEFSIGLKF